MRFVTATAVVSTMIVAGLYVTQDRMIYNPEQVVIALATKVPDGVDVTYRTEDGLTLHGWWVRGRDTTTDRPPAVVAFHGRAGNRGALWRMSHRLAERGISVLLAEYRGYGDSPGAPSEAGLARDARAAARYVAGRPDVDPSAIVYLGESLGSGVATRLATEIPARGLVLISPFTSLPEAASSRIPVLPLDLLMRDRFDVIGRVKNLGTPMLVIAGTDDVVVPVTQSRAVHRSARIPDAYLEVMGMGHHAMELYAGTRSLNEIERFARQHRRT